MEKPECCDLCGCESTKLARCRCGEYLCNECKSAYLMSKEKDHALNTPHSHYDRAHLALSRWLFIDGPDEPIEN